VILLKLVRYFCRDLNWINVTHTRVQYGALVNTVLRYTYNQDTIHEIHTSAEHQKKECHDAHCTSFKKKSFTVLNFNRYQADSSNNIFGPTALTGCTTISITGAGIAQ
jgi:hypothetical protein